MAVLSEIIKAQIIENGPMSFRDFMEMALYYPELGYYNAPRDKIGSAGDFYTSANLTPAFGAMIARQIEEMWTALEKKPFTIVEFGAGTGLLCHDILSYLKNNSELYDTLTYCIIEKSVHLQQIQKKHLTEKVSWFASIEEIPKINGCVLSNELIDNFAVHQVVMEDQLQEVFVDYDGDFKEVLKPAAKELVNYFKDLNIQLPNGFRTEVNLEALSWIKKIAQSIENGYVITIDYGNTSAELYHPRKHNGTLVCYHKHQINDNPYQCIGEQDITSHVNFSALCSFGFKNGLECCGLINQAQFLLALGFIEYQKSSFEKLEASLQYFGINLKLNIQYWWARVRNINFLFK
jgi:SAM-dependent MidA family methyltransferase